MAAHSPRIHSSRRQPSSSSSSRYNSRRRQLTASTAVQHVRLWLCLPEKTHLTTILTWGLCPARPAAAAGPVAAAGPAAAAGPSPGLHPPQHPQATVRRMLCWACCRAPARKRRPGSAASAAAQRPHQVAAQRAKHRRLAPAGRRHARGLHPSARRERQQCKVGALLWVGVVTLGSYCMRCAYCSCIGPHYALICSNHLPGSPIRSCHVLFSAPQIVATTRMGARMSCPAPRSELAAAAAAAASAVPAAAAPASASSQMRVGGWVLGCCGVLCTAAGGVWGCCAMQLLVSESLLHDPVQRRRRAAHSRVAFLISCWLRTRSRQQQWHPLLPLPTGRLRRRLSAAAASSHGHSSSSSSSG